MSSRRVALALLAALAALGAGGVLFESGRAGREAGRVEGGLSGASGGSAVSALDRIPPDWPHRSHSRTLPVGELDWHVQVMGRGPTVVLLHGTGSSSHSWAEVMPALAEVATVVAPDLPGHGYTRGARLEELTLPRMAADLEALVGALGLPPPVLVVGHSAGAPLAVRWALQTPSPPRHILGLNPSLVPPPPSYDWVAPYLNPIATSSPVASLLAAVAGPSGMVDRLLDSTGSRLTAAQRARYASLFADPGHVRGAMGFMAAADLPGLLEAGRALDVPLTFVLGRADTWVPEPALRAVVERHFPQATVRRWEGGHLLHEVEPARAAQLVRQLLDTLE